MARESRAAAPRRHIKKLRELIGYAHGTQTKWAREHGISMSHLNNVLHGRRPVTERLIKILQEATVE